MLLQFLNLSHNKLGRDDETVVIKFDPNINELSCKPQPPNKSSPRMYRVYKVLDECETVSNKEYNDCIADGIADEVSSIINAKSLIKKYKSDLADRMYNYSCNDETLETSSTKIIQRTLLQGVEYDVHVHLDKKASKILSIPHFVTSEECSHLVEYAQGRFTDAPVISEDGTSTISKLRRANQASYTFPIDKIMDGDRLWPLYTRIIDMANIHGGMNYELPLEGQEGFTIIQYRVGDAYAPHCDGRCDGSRFEPGHSGRVATALLYCATATRGGGTVFPHADVFIKPEPGMMLLFSYKGSDGFSDPGYTEHGGCAVAEGEKVVVSAWLREGVSSDNPWSLYDPYGVKMPRSTGKNADEGLRVESIQEHEISATL